MTQNDVHPQIRYSERWDKLGNPRHTTIRSQYHYRPKLPPLDKADFYTVSKLYTEVVMGRPLQDVRLTCVELYLAAIDLPEELLKADVMLGGVPDMGWYKKIRQSGSVMVLHLEVVKKREKDMAIAGRR